MLRDLRALSEQEFDVLVIGGGAFAACAAWESVLRGYSVALIEANDFASGTSANSFKMVHGGIRYLQHLDLGRLWASCKERSALLRIAPHMVKPLPIVMPTYGHGRRGKEFLGAGFLLYDALTAGRNRGIRDSSRHIPMAGFMTRDEVRKRFDGLAGEGLTGAAVFNDAQMYHPPRLVLEFILSAAQKGAVVRNYVEAVSLRRSLNRIVGVVARDRLTGEEFEIRSKVVVNAAGPWSESLLGQDNGLKVPGGGTYSRDTCFVIDGAPEPNMALAIQGASIDKGSLIARGARHLFVVPWRGRRLVGVWHIVYRRNASDIEISEQEIERFLGEFNSSPGAGRIERSDIRLVNAGLVPFGDSDDVGEELNFGKRSHLVDSAAQHGIEGLITLIGVRHTMARGDAAKAIDIVDRKMRRKRTAPDSSVQPLLGGDYGSFADLVAKVQVRLKNGDARGMSTELASLYGSRVHEVLDYGQASEVHNRIADSDIISAQIGEAIHNEMATTLGDVVFRRTPLAAAGNPGLEVLRVCAQQMGSQFGWSGERQQREIHAVLNRFPTTERSGTISEAPIEHLVGLGPRQWKKQ